MATNLLMYADDENVESVWPYSKTRAKETFVILNVIFLLALTE
jgi:hypothetical protein